MIYDCFPPSKQERYGPVHLLRDEYDGEENNPSPEYWSVNYQQSPVEPVAKVGEVEDLEVAASPDEAHRADHHGGQDDDEGYARGVGVASDQSKHSGIGREHPVSVAPPRTKEQKDIRRIVRTQ